MKNIVHNFNCQDWNPTQIKKHHYNEYGARHLNFFYVYRAYWIPREMKVSVVGANCCEDSKIAVNNNTVWNTYVKQITNIYHFSNGKVTDELKRMKDHFAST